MMPIEAAIGFEGCALDDLVENVIRHVGEVARRFEVGAERVSLVLAIDALAPARIEAAQLAQALPADLQQHRGFLGNDRGAPRQTGERRKLAEQIALSENRRLVPRDGRGDVDAAQPAGGVLPVGERVVIAATLTGFGHGLGRDGPREQPPPAAPALAPAEERRRQARLQNHPELPGKHEEGRVAVVAFAQDDLARREGDDAGVVRDDALERNARRQRIAPDRGEFRTPQDLLHPRPGHVGAEWPVPALRPLDRRGADRIAP